MNEPTRSGGPAPGFIDSPNHRVDVEPIPQRIRVMFGNEIVADTTKALLMLETNHKPVYYFPRADVRMDMFVRTDHASF
jgi:uncharacterized protein (DUF427 family)